MDIYQWVLLAVLAAQTAAYVLLAKYVFQRPGAQIDSMVLVLFVEVCKLVLSLAAYLCEVKSFGKWRDGLWVNALETRSLASVAGLSVVYVVQNNASYVALRNMGAARFQVTYQIKIVMTTVLCVVLLKKAVSKGQWLSVGLLTLGVALLQLDRTHAQQSLSKLERTLSENEAPTNAFIGLACLLIAALCSSFAGVYNEKLLKESSFSIWIVNIQMYFTGSAFSMVAIVLVDRSAFDVPVLFGRVDLVVFGLISLSSAGGLIVSLVLKHAGNILKSFAVGISIIIAAISSSVIFMEAFGVAGVAGVVLVLLAIPLYAMFHQPPPKEIVTEDPVDLLVHNGGANSQEIEVVLAKDYRELDQEKLI